MKQIGVLALQGDFEAHALSVEKTGAKAVLVKEADQLEKIDGLIIPGGESTTLLKLLEYEGMTEKLIAFGQQKPVFGTCAGAILMAKEVSNPKQFSFGWLDIHIERNSYGRQIDSHIKRLTPEPTFQKKIHMDQLEAFFIRAPRILKTGKGVQVLATCENDPVLVEQGMHMAATFHPELTSNTTVHAFFLKKIMEN